MTPINYGQLQHLMNDPNVKHITINHPKFGTYWHMDDGITELHDLFADATELAQFAQSLAKIGGVTLDMQNPIAEVRFDDGARAQLIFAPIATEGAVIHLRKPYLDTMTMETMVEIKAIHADAAKYLKACIKARMNIAVVGSFFSAKPTIMNMLMQEFPLTSPVGVIQSASEISIPHPNRVVLERRKADIHGQGAITNRTLLESLFVLKSHRIMITELDGSEVSVLLDGLSTAHNIVFGMEATSPQDAITRLEMAAVANDMSQPLLSIRDKIARSLDVIVYTDLMHDFRQRIISVTQVKPMHGDAVGLETLFHRTASDDWQMVPTENTPRIRDRIHAWGTYLPETPFNPEETE